MSSYIFDFTEVEIIILFVTLTFHLSSLSVITRQYIKNHFNAIIILITFIYLSLDALKEGYTHMHTYMRAHTNTHTYIPLHICTLYIHKYI